VGGDCGGLGDFLCDLVSNLMADVCVMKEEQERVFPARPGRQERERPGVVAGREVEDFRRIGAGDD